MPGSKMVVSVQNCTSVLKYVCLGQPIEPAHSLSELLLLVWCCPMNIEFISVLDCIIQ